MDTNELIKQCRAIRLSKEGGKVTFKSRMKTRGKTINRLLGGENPSLNISQDKKIKGSNATSVQNRSGSQN